MLKVALLSFSHKGGDFHIFHILFCMFVLLYSVIIISKLGCVGWRVLLCCVL